MRFTYIATEHRRPKILSFPSNGKDAFLVRLDIPNNFSQPNGCDIIYREVKPMPEIFTEHAILKQLKTLSL